MQAIKSFVYLDEYKMYSISSQIFEGVTESLMSYEGSTIEKEEEQKGPIGSGQIMAEILKSESGTQEKKYLHDYYYTLFEDHLKNTEKILSISSENIDENIEQIDSAGFIEVRGEIVFYDMNNLQSTIENFNKLGAAVAYIANFETIETDNQQLKTLEKSTKDRNEKAKIRQGAKRAVNVEKLAKDRGLNLDAGLLKNGSFVLDYGFRDQFVVQMSIGQYTFSADCKRDDLREDEHLLIRKYSRFPEKKFVLVGTIAQSSSEPVDREDYTRDSDEFSHPKESVMALAEKLSGLESIFSGKLKNEIIVDPIALYWEI